MKPNQKNGFQSDDENVRYKLNMQYFNNLTKSPKSSPKPSPTKQSPKQDKKPSPVKVDKTNIYDGACYKFPEARIKLNKIELKPHVMKSKTKPTKIKVNFWSSKQTANRLNKDNTKRRHTVGGVTSAAAIPKNSVVRKRVSFLPTPLFSDNHNPMVTVPDDLTINLNEEEANDLREDLNSGYENNANSFDSLNRHSRSSTTQTSPRGHKRKNSPDELRGHNNENELEYFSKYIIQKLRRMETNQRIYSENLINTVLMLGQLGKLNVKSKIADNN